jgi:hydrogenase maturation factor
LLEKHTPTDPRVILGPGVGLDCAVLEFGENFLIAKSDPITFTAEEIGWYAVHVNANDIVTTGAKPRWFLATLLLPAKSSDETMVRTIFRQITDACRSIEVELVGGHSEITTGLDRPIVAGTMLGEVAREKLITPNGARPGDQLLLTKGIPIEATSILAREFSNRLLDIPANVIDRARNFLHHPGISVVPEALAASRTGHVTAMHDPTEGGLAAGVWEMAIAADVGFVIDREAIYIPPESDQICAALGINPIESIASGALLLTVNKGGVGEVVDSIHAIGTKVTPIGDVIEGHDVAMRSADEIQPLPWPKRDAIAQLFEED